MSALISKIEQYTRLSPADRSILTRATADRPRRFRPRVDILGEGDRPRDMMVMLSGWACRYKQLEDGRRQILSLFLPGDVCDFNVVVLRELDHSIGTLSSVTLTELPRELADEIAHGHPRIAAAFLWLDLVAASIQREWTMNLGQRTATERMAHLLCEIFLRLQPIGLIHDNACEFPLTQADLAEATGLSKVHVNRTLQELRAAELIVLRGKTLIIPDPMRLMDIALFNPNYLHMNHEGSRFDANANEGNAACRNPRRTAGHDV